MYVIKADGTKEKFDKEKIVRTCINAGTEKSVARNVADKIESAIKDGTSTHEIYKMIISELEKKEEGVSLKFRLRESISKIDPDIFEMFFARVLREHGYSCKWNVLVSGLCIQHQVDIIAEKDSKLFLVECKRHVNPHRFTGLSVCLQVQARLEDVRDGFEHRKNKYDFDYAWIVTNTKFSDHAKIYAKAKNIRLSGWKYEKEISMENLVQSKKIYPITILKADSETLKKLMKNRIITVRDILKPANRKILARCAKKDAAKSLVSQAENLLF